MADIALSSRGITATFTGGYIYIITPDGGSPTGYSSFRMTEVAFKADLQALIDINIAGIASNAANIVTLQNVGTRKQYPAQTGDVQWTQPANSNVTRITCRSTNLSGTNRVRIGYTVGTGTVFDWVELGILANDIFGWDELLYTRSARTLFISTNGDVDITIYYTLNEF